MRRKKTQGFQKRQCKVLQDLSLVSQKSFWNIIAQSTGFTFDFNGAFAYNKALEV